ncbi:hypothetical protein CsSME_00006049 [Camellia sinensis var. sinensis]
MAEGNGGRDSSPQTESTWELVPKPKDVKPISCKNKAHGVQELHSKEVKLSYDSYLKGLTILKGYPTGFYIFFADLVVLGSPCGFHV